MTDLLDWAGGLDVARTFLKQARRGSPRHLSRMSAKLTVCGRVDTSMVSVYGHALVFRWYMLKPGEEFPALLRKVTCLGCASMYAAAKLARDGE